MSGIATETLHRAVKTAHHAELELSRSRVDPPNNHALSAMGQDVSNSDVSGRRRGGRGGRRNYLCRECGSDRSRNSTSHEHPDHEPSPGFKSRSHFSSTHEPHNNHPN
ncbi:unnamed protein product, partial [Sphacelaria rigidula]